MCTTSSTCSWSSSDDLSGVTHKCGQTFELTETPPTPETTSVQHAGSLISQTTQTHTHTQTHTQTHTHTHRHTHTHTDTHTDTHTHTHRHTHTYTHTHTHIQTHTHTHRHRHTHTHTDTHTHTHTHTHSRHTHTVPPTPETTSVQHAGSLISQTDAVMKQMAQRQLNTLKELASCLPEKQVKKMTQKTIQK